MSNTKDWTKPNDNNEIDVPDELMPLFNKLGTQIRLHTISGKNEVLTVAHCVWNAQKFFQSRISELEAENEKNIKWANDAETRAVAAEERIVELEAENKRLREEHRWIPVTERLPERRKTSGIYVTLLRMILFIACIYADGKWWYEERFDITEWVTHWQPLPQPPKEQ